jgi:Spy/CpxP family protein refolding chaperone
MKIPLAAAMIALAVATAPAVRAQGSAAEGTELKTLLEQSKTPAGKRAIVASTLDLTDAEAKKFWPVYDAYQRKLDGINRQYSRAIEDVVMSGRPVSDAYARNLAKDLAEVEDADTRARKSMYSSVVKVLPGRKAIRYLQLENKVQAGYRYEVASTFPLVK